MDDFVRKPYRFGEIYDCLARQLGLKYVYRSLAAEAQIALGSAIRILIVDDDDDSRFLTRELMKKSNFMLRDVASGTDALQVFGDWQPHLVLMDMRMPGMDGMETTRRLRALPGGDKALVVALTAGALDEQRAGLIAAGCDEVIAKPVDLNRVNRLLAQYLERHTADVAPVRELRSDDLPAALRQQLLDAAIRLDDEGVAAVCADLDAEQPEVAAAIRALAENYRYDELVRRLQEARPD
jgi:CheY-like chemotaxis protein